MYLCGYSLDNLSLMALTISTGFVVDDAIVVIENITRYLEKGMRPMEAALQGRAGDRLHGALHQPFAGGGIHSDPADGRHRGPFVPRVCRDLVRGDPGFAGDFADHHAHDVFPASADRDPEETHGRIYRASEKVFSVDAARLTNARLRWVLRHPAFTLVVLLLTIGAQCLSVRDRAQGLFPAAGQRHCLWRHPGRAGYFVPGHAGLTASNVCGHHQDRSGGGKCDGALPAADGAVKRGFVYLALKPLDERKISAEPD